MNRNLIWRLSLFLAGLLVFACAPSGPPLAQPKTPAGTSQIAGASWEQKWTNVVAEAKKEGAVTVYSSGTVWTPATRNAVTEALKKKFGIDLNLVILGLGPEVAARVQREHMAGVRMADVIAIGVPPLIFSLKPAGVLGDIESLLLLPEVTDPRVWGGKLPFIDKDKKVVGTVVQISRNVAYNTDLVKKGEITSYKDLLKAQYKGKIILGDPTLAGSANGMFAALAVSTWNLQEAKDFLLQLVKQQEAVITRDTRLMAESLAKGKYMIAVAPSPTVMKQFLGAGAPLDLAMLKEGTNANLSNGSMGIPAMAPHPSAARVFINWLLSKEGQTIFARTQDSPSLRADITVEGIDPRFLPQPGEKVFYETEESVTFGQQELPGMVNDVYRQAGVK